MNKFNIEIASPPNRDSLVAEIWFGKSLIAELYQENDNLRIELYSSRTAFDYNDFLEALTAAQKSIITA
jgi:hypothetical protein